MAQSNLAVIQGIYAAMVRDDGPAIFGAMDPGIVWHEGENFIYADRSPYVGPAAVAEGLFSRFATEWDNFAVTANAYHDAGDSVVATGRYTGTYKKTGKALDAQFAHVWGLRGGKVTSFQQYTDTAQSRDVTQG